MGSQPLLPLPSLPSPLFGTAHMGLSSSETGRLEPFSGLPGTHISQTSRQFSNGREGGHSWYGGWGVGSEAPGGSWGHIQEKHTKREQAGSHWTGQESERRQDTGRGFGAGCQLLGAIFCIALAIRLALLLSLQVICAQLLLFFPPHTLDHHQHQDDHSQEAPH